MAGTATSLAAVDQELEPYDPARVHGYQLALADCERMLAMLAALPLHARRDVPGSTPTAPPRSSPARRSWCESCAPSASTEVETSEADILHGAALDGLSGR